MFLLAQFETKMEWNGMEWNGMEWNGMEYYQSMIITCTGLYFDYRILTKVKI